MLFTPVAGYEIKITYFKLATDLTFDIGKNASGISAFVNGAKANGYYNPSNGEVSLNPSPPHGAKVKIVFKRDNGVRTKYRATGPDGAPVSQWHYNGKFYSARRDGDDVILNIDKSMFKGGEVVQVIYELPKGYKRKYTLSGYVDKTLKVEKAPSQCPAENFQVEGNQLTFVCDPGNSDEEILLSYQSYTYNFILISDVYDGDAGTWEVKVDGQPTTSGKVARHNTPPGADPAGSYFTFNPPITKGHTITIQFFPQGSVNSTDPMGGGTGLP
jgi:hypothetical protein